LEKSPIVRFAESAAHGEIAPVIAFVASAGAEFTGVETCGAGPRGTTFADDGAGSVIESRWLTAAEAPMMAAFWAYDGAAAGWAATGSAGACGGEPALGAIAPADEGGNASADELAIAPATGDEPPNETPLDICVIPPLYVGDKRIASDAIVAGVARSPRTSICVSFFPYAIPPGGRTLLVWIVEMTSLSVRFDADSCAGSTTTLYAACGRPRTAASATPSVFSIAGMICALASCARRSVDSVFDVSANDTTDAWLGFATRMYGASKSLGNCDPAEATER